MKTTMFFRRQRGQALHEMLVVIPLLILLAAGLAQLTLVIRAKIAFEDACGKAARIFALGDIRSKDLGPSLWENLGPDQKYFDQGSILVSARQPNSLLGGDLQEDLGFLGMVMKEGLFNYGGADWIVTIRYRGAPVLGPLFPNGILFKAQLAVLRHPA
ncbi:MAG TPA: TadE/TadG family type IV pilus assembly protein [bacterium]|nr:TadE/TadG family type IV pilus assembly protein [bacterium]